MSALLENWFFLAVLLGCVAMHFFGHGHRGHPGQGDGPGEKRSAGERETEPAMAKGASAAPGGALDVRVWFWSVGSATSLSFVLCVAWGLLTPEALHMHELLELALPGFRWLSPGAFAIGLVESFAYGAYAGLVFVPLHNFFQRRWQGRHAS